MSKNTLFYSDINSVKPVQEHNQNSATMGSLLPYRTSLFTRTQTKACIVKKKKGWSNNEVSVYIVRATMNLYSCSV